MKYLKGPQGGLIGPHIYPSILSSRNDGDSNVVLFIDGVIMNFPREQVGHNNSFD